MTLRKKLFLVFLTPILLCLNTHAKASCNEGLSVGWEHWPPYQYVNTERVLVGLDIELMTAIAEQAKCKIQFYEIPWKRHLLELELGRVDVALAASHDEDRAKYAYFSQPVRKERVSLFTLHEYNKDIKNSNIEALLRDNFKLGTTLGYHYGSKFDALLKDKTYSQQIEETHTDQLNFMKLFRGRLDGILVDPISVPYQIKRMHEARQLKRAFDIYTTDVHLMFSKKSVSEQTLKAFNQALKKIKENGIYDDILERYLSLET